MPAPRNRAPFTEADAKRAGFDDTQWPQPQTRTLVGHWDGNTLVVEYQLMGQHADERPDTGHWPEGLWADSLTGTSEVDLAVQAWAEYDEADTVRPALYESDRTPNDGED